MQLAGSADTAGEVEQRLAMEQVTRMMQHLNPAQQEVISLRFSGGLSAEEAGAVMRRTARANRELELQRTALKALRALMGPEATHLDCRVPEDGWTMTTRRSFAEILDECVDRVVVRGESIDACVRDFPERARELRGHRTYC